MKKRRTPLTKTFISASLVFALILCLASVLIFYFLGQESLQDLGSLIAKYTIIQIIATIALSVCFICFFTGCIKKQEGEGNQNEAGAVNIRDELTGIRNKMGFAEEIKRVEERIKDGDTQVGLALCDLNFLDTINEKYGKDKGDLAIKDLCRLICVTFEHSPVFRIIGGEFAIVLKGQDFHNYDVLADTLIDEMQDAFFDDRLEPWERISAAIAAVAYDPNKHHDFDFVFKEAEEKMFEKKRTMKGVEE